MVKETGYIITAPGNSSERYIADVLESTDVLKRTDEYIILEYWK